MIELRKVSASYTAAWQLRDVQVHFKKEALSVIIGPNGCGKTTMLRVMSRLLKPQSGAVLFDREDMMQYSPKAYAKRVSLLPQNRIQANMSVYSLVMHGRYPYLGFGKKPTREDEAKVAYALELTNAAQYQHQNIAELSGGQRQLAYIASTIAQDTAVVLLDEPTTYLDIRHQLEMIRIIRELRNAGKTVIAVMHDVAQALDCADYICLMRDGQVLLYDTPQRIYQSGKIDEVFCVHSRQIADGGKTYYTFDKRE